MRSIGDRLFTLKGRRDKTNVRSSNCSDWDRSTDPLGKGDPMMSTESDLHDVAARWDYENCCYSGNWSANNRHDYIKILNRQALDALLKAGHEDEAVKRAKEKADRAWDKFYTLMGTVMSQVKLHEQERAEPKETK